MATRITPQVGRVYRRNETAQVGPDIVFDMVRGTTVRVNRLTDRNVVGTIVEGNDGVSPGRAFNPFLRYFTDEFFDPEPVA